LSKILITGAADGLGREAAAQLARGGHEVIVHARTQPRVDAALAAVPGAAAGLAADLASLSETAVLAERVNRRGRLDAVIHNAGIGYREAARELTADGIEHVFHVNVVAPYLLTALIEPPERLVYLSSGLHRAGHPDLDDVNWERREWNGYQAYCDSKLFDAVLAAAVARRRPAAISSSVDPGWVKTKMGGPGAPGELGPGADTQVWLATSQDPAALNTGTHFRHRHPVPTHPAVSDEGVQEELLAVCARLTGHALDR
jgi:NAD(P)-dependent dehydrogenase (short-subunit alcohol dehydrogenase family)